MRNFLSDYFFPQKTNEKHIEKNISDENEKVSINNNEIKSYVFIFEIRPYQTVDVAQFQSGEKDEWVKSKALRFGPQVKKFIGFPVYDSLEDLWARETSQDQKSFYLSMGSILCLNRTVDEVYELIDANKFHEAYHSALSISEAKKLLKTTEYNQNISKCGL